MSGDPGAIDGVEFLARVAVGSDSLNYLIAAKPEDVTLLTRRARAHFALSEWDEGIADYATAIELDPNNPSHHHDCAAGYEKITELGSALASYSKAIELDPEFIRYQCLHFHRANVYADKGQFEQAVSDFSSAIDQAHAVLDAWYLRALAQVGMGDLDAYRNSCANMLEEFAPTADASRVDRLAWTCALAPDAIAAYSGLVEVTENETATTGSQPLIDGTTRGAIFAALPSAWRTDIARYRGLISRCFRHSSRDTNSNSALASHIAHQTVSAAAHVKERQHQLLLAAAPRLHPAAKIEGVHLNGKL